MDTKEPQAEKTAPAVAPQTVNVVQTVYNVPENTTVVAAITAAIMHHRQG